MRLAHHLLRHPTGVWHFRVIVPRHLQAVLGRRVIKRSLRTKDPDQARLWAYALGAHYGQIFASAKDAGEHGMAGKKWNDQAVADVMKGVSAAPDVRHWEAEGPDGWKIRTDGSERDNAAGLEALRAVLQIQTPAAISPTAPPPDPSSDQPPTLGEALKIYEETEVPNLKPDTWAQRERAIRSFIQMYGEGRRVTTVTRQMSARWATDLQRSGLTKRYVANQVSHVAQLFEAQIRAGHFAPGTNPVKGVVVFKAADKKMVKASGRG